ncbi:hypothetical protein FRC04_008389 [Tulasnella sp. 424]|nr:hypothetical protein FRC04_008389 [Tulasnella sp. 424]KAG8976761.1 hypothetical protein FRC05_003111 [Tulasnella sp. 425]
MNAVSEKQIEVQEIFQHSHSSFDSTKSWSRRNRLPKLLHDVPPSKLDPKLELQSPVTSAGNEGLSKLGPINGRALRIIAFLCLAATCWKVARFAMVLREIDGRPSHVPASETLEHAYKEMGEAENAPWWKVAAVKPEVEVDVDDPDAVTSSTGSGEMAQWWSEEALRGDMALLG